MRAAFFIKIYIVMVMLMVNGYAMVIVSREANSEGPGAETTPEWLQFCQDDCETLTGQSAATGVLDASQFNTDHPFIGPNKHNVTFPGGRQLSVSSASLTIALTDMVCCFWKTTSHVADWRQRAQLTHGFLDAFTGWMKGSLLPTMHNMPTLTTSARQAAAQLSKELSDLQRSGRAPAFFLENSDQRSTFEISLHLPGVKLGTWVVGAITAMILMLVLVCGVCVVVFMPSCQFVG